MVPLNELTKESILEEKIFEEIFDQEDEFYKSKLLLSVQDRAKELGVLKQFEELTKGFKRRERQIVRSAREQQKRNVVSMLDNWTNFTGDYDNMKCGAWIAGDNGVYAQNQMGNNDIVACYHPILPVRRLKNLETGEEHIVIAYKRNGVWYETKVAKDVIASGSKIVALSKQGVSVTSENAKHLVKYLNDVENLNDDFIEVQRSTSKLGWHGDVFMPYSDEIVFDGDDRFRDVIEAVKERGREDRWLEYVRELRKSGKKQIKIALAASFAAPLVSLLNALPFIIDFWGQSGSGKSVLSMLAASVWADPSENQYIGGFNTSEVGLEVRCDMLDNLPVILDDTSTISAKIKDFEGVVYSLCSGKGRTRSNKDLGLRQENRWKNCTITNGEHPLRSYVQQGGAINRILEIECLEGTFDDPAETVAVLQKNYGFAGKRFIEILKAIQTDDLKQICADFQSKIGGSEIVQKQVLALAIVLTADKIATDYIFKDGLYITVDEVSEALADVNYISDNERCYSYLMDKISMNQVRFDDVTGCEKWGVIELEYAYIYSQAFNELCRQGRFSGDAFLTWAKRKGIVKTTKDRLKLKKRIGGGNPVWCVALRICEDEGTGTFVPVDPEQEELPFH